MSDSQKHQSNNFVQVGERPYVLAYVQKPAFHVGDKVYLLNSTGFREGPYLVASLPSTAKCTLCTEDGKVVRNGEEIDVDCIEAS